MRPRPLRHSPARWRTLLLLLVTAVTAAAAPRHVYLTWQADPATAITVNFHALGARAGAPGEVRYDTAAHAGDPAAYAFTARGQAVAAPDAGRAVWHIELTDLEPGRSYWFVAGEATAGFSPERALRTAPTGDVALRFVVGGDMGVAHKTRRLQTVAAAQEPLFAIVGGDLAYAEGRDWATWDLWLDNWEELMVTPAGYTVPIVAAIGNHEVDGGYGATPDAASTFLAYLAQEGERTYYARRVGERVLLLVLDSGHLAAHGGQQSHWLEEQLARNPEAPVRLAAYHVPLFPGFRLDSGRHSRAGRRHWQPLFDRFRVMAAFEHHDHLFKRTHALRGDRIDEGGTIYLGDGAFGRGPRTIDGPRQVHLRRRWYLARLMSEGHVWRVDVGSDSVTFTAVNGKGVEFDRVARPIGAR